MVTSPSLSILGSALIAFCGGFASLAEAQETNRYAAPFADIAPVVDGVVDPAWSNAPWDTLAYNYLAGTSMPGPTDLFARYKAVWDARHLYLLVEVVDDSVSDRTANPLSNWWNDDAVEIFLDEDHSGGDHQYNFSAWAYHVSTKYDAVDYGDDEQPHLFNDHMEVRRAQTGHTSVWEFAILVYGKDYTLAGPNTPVTLSAPKTMGFSLAYCDNDGKTSRESFVGSVNTPGHLNNEGYLDASVFGSLDLLPASTTTRPRPAQAPGVERRADGFRLASPTDLRIQRLDGTLSRSVSATPGQWLGTDLPRGLYAVTSTDRTQAFLFARP